MGTAVKRIIGESGGQSYMFYYWFFTGEKNYSEEWQSLLNISLQTLFSGRSDGGIVEISAPIAGGKSRDEAIANADRVIEDFITIFYPTLSELIHNPQVISK